MNNTGEINPQLLSTVWTEMGVLVLDGDLDNQTGSSVEVLNAYDEIFDFANSNTIVSLGNHDYSNLAEWEAVSGHKTFYTTTIGQTVFLFLTTNRIEEV